MITLLTGDCRQLLPTLDAGSVQCVVTSPPYFGLRDYGTATWAGGDAGCSHQADRQPRTERERSGLTGSLVYVAAQEPAYRATCGKCGAQRIDAQIGLEPTLDEYVQTLVKVFREVHRVLRDDGTIFLNLGDSYGPGKQLLGVPWAVAKALQEPYYTGRLPNVADRAYLAGFLDGEGTISFVERDRGPDHTPTHDARIFVTNCDADVLHYFANATAGHVYQHEDGRRENRLGSLPCYRWQMGTHDGALLLRELYPYLRSKRKQAALIWTLYTTLRHRNGHARTPTDVVARRREIAGMVRTLNAGGDVTLPSWVIEPPAPTEPGFILRSDVIWSKPNPMPESVTDRPTRAHEYIFVLTKRERYFWDAQAVAEPSAQPFGIATLTGQHKADAGGFTTNGHGPSTLGTNQGATTRNLRSVWTIATQPYAGAHFATFPEALVERCILAGTSPQSCEGCGAPWSRVVERGDHGLAFSDATPVPRNTPTGGIQSRRVTNTADFGKPGSADLPPRIVHTTGWRATCACPDTTGSAACVVLDPFAGSGTVLRVAIKHNRSAIGIDLSPDYADLQLKRTDGVQRRLL